MTPDKSLHWPPGVRTAKPLVAWLCLASAPVSHAAGQACSVEGLTARWALSYCMFRYETDDEANLSVSTCFSRELASLDRDDAEDCDANRTFKTAICTLRIQHGRFEGTLTDCLLSVETVPPVVLEGVTGH